MACKDGVRQITKAFAAVVVLIVLTARPVSSQPRVMTCLDSQDGHAILSGQRDSRTV